MRSSVLTARLSASCARIKHLWQLEPTEREFEEDAKRMLLKVEEFIKLKCQTMARHVVRAGRSAQGSEVQIYSFGWCEILVCLSGCYANNTLFLL